MNYFVLLKMVPDTVEELEIAEDGKSLDQEVIRLKLADSDEHAVEEALILKERHGGTITVMALEGPEVDDALYTALAKGVDRAVKITGDWSACQSVAAAQVLAQALAPDGALPGDSLVMLRSQSIDDLEGEVGPYLAERLGAPFLGIVTEVKAEGSNLLVTREFAGGLRGEYSVPLPAVLGIQSAEKPPRYVPIAKVRAAMKSATIETVEVTAPENLACVGVARMYKPEATGRAEMLEGSPEEVADKLVEVMAKQSLI